jgi:hypothetical protein
MNESTPTVAPTTEKESVKRCRCVLAGNYIPIARMEEDQDGDWVAFSDYDSLSTRLAAMEKLAHFALWAIDLHRDNDCADIDGGAIQEKLVELGVLVERTQTQCCGDHCACMDAGEQDEWTCYFLADDLNAIRSALQGASND